jgi:hypothetical protein
MGSGERPAKPGRLIGATALSIAAHLLILLALISARPSLPRPSAPVPVSVELVDAPQPAAPAAPAASSAPSASRPFPRPTLAPPPPRRPTPGPRDVDPLPAGDGGPADSGSELTGAQLAGAASADSGRAGRDCDMARRVQAALRRDPLVQAAVAGLAGKAVLVWNGDWVRSGGEDGKGLAAVREAIMWEVAFAPRACRAEPVRGLVLLSLNETPGSARLAVGSSQWRWSDLLTPRPAGAG